MSTLERVREVAADLPAAQTSVHRRLLQAARYNVVIKSARRDQAEQAVR